MAKISYYFDIMDDGKIGWYSTSTAKPNPIPDKDTSIIRPTSTSKLSNVGINSAYLIIDFDAAGRDVPKQFTFSFGSITTKNISSLTSAFKEENVKFNLSSETTFLEKWVESPTSITISDPGELKGSPGAWCSAYYSKILGTPVLEIDYTPKTINFSIDNSNIETGASRTITIQNYQANNTYSLFYKIDNNNPVEITTFSQTDGKFTVPHSFFSSHSDTQTVNGELILNDQTGNSNSLPVIFSAGPGLKPIISGVSITSDTFVDGNTDYCAVPGKSFLTFIFSSAAYYNATVQKYEVKVENFTASSSSNIVEIQVPNSTSTSLNFTCTVTDSRGLTSLTTQNTIYLSPELSDNKGLVIKQYYRTSSSNSTTPVSDDSGEYLFLDCDYKKSFTYYNLTSDESKTLQSTNSILTILIGNNSYKLSNKLIWGSASKPETFSADESITCTIQLKYGSYIIKKEITYPSKNYLLHFYKDKNSIGIGCAAKNEDKVITMGWDVHLKNPLGVAYGGTGYKTLDDLANNLANNTYFTNKFAPIGSSGGGGIDGIDGSGNTIEFSKPLSFVNDADKKTSLTNLGVIYKEKIPDTVTNGALLLVPIS